MTPTYQSEAWFAMLQDAVARSNQSEVARQLARSATTINLVLHGKGNYGNGKASTGALAQRVVDTFGNWDCPYLSDDDTPRTINAEQCRTYAHREAPTGSPRDLAHWRACRTCPMKDHSAPPPQRIVIPRQRRQPEPIQQSLALGDPK